MRSVFFRGMIVLVAVLLALRESYAQTLSTNFNKTGYCGGVLSTSVSGFDSSLGVLLRGTLSIDFLVQSDFRVESLSGLFPSTVILDVDAKAYLDALGLRLFEQGPGYSFEPVLSTSFPVSAYDGVADYGGTSGRTLISDLYSPGLSQNYVDTATLAVLSSGAPFFVESACDGLFSYTAPDNHNAQIGMSQQVTGSMTYTYDPYPVCVVDAQVSGVCSTSRTSVSLNGGMSHDLDSMGGVGSLSYSWSSNCPGYSFSNATVAAPQLEFDSLSNGLPSSCQAILEINDGLSTRTCQTQISVSACPVDCAGTPLGKLAVDACGVCGGTGSSCADCLGVPHGTAVSDSCGVCNGNGLSCRSGCTSSPTQELSFSMDSSAADLLASTRSLSILARASGVGRTRLLELREQAAGLYNRAWTLAWSLPSSMLSCSNLSGCSYVELTSTRESYASAISELHQIGMNLGALISRHGTKKLRKRLLRLERNIELACQSAQSALARVPAAHVQRCS